MLAPMVTNMTRSVYIHVASGAYSVLVLFRWTVLTLCRGGARIFYIFLSESKVHTDFLFKLGKGGELSLSFWGDSHTATL